jgi:hypothetical protein
MRWIPRFLVETQDRSNVRLRQAWRSRRPQPHRNLALLAFE